VGLLSLFFTNHLLGRCGLLEGMQIAFFAVFQIPVPVEDSVPEGFGAPIPGGVSLQGFPLCKLLCRSSVHVLHLISPPLSVIII
jgi:hypothetical protein